VPQIQLPLFPAASTAITNELAATPLLPRFTLVFDREGYSPELFARLWTEHRIAILSYPGTNLSPKFTPIRSPAFPAGQDV